MYYNNNFALKAFFERQELVAHNPQQKGGEQGWGSDQNACLRPVWAVFDSTRLLP